MLKWLPRRWLQRLWNAPSSVFGLAGALGGKWRWNKSELVLEVAGGWLIGTLSHAGWASAITLGEVVLYADARLIPVLHDHEMVHIRQGRLWGPFFLPAYVLESAYQWLRTGDGYRRNRFEVAAYEYAPELSAEASVPGSSPVPPSLGTRGFKAVTHSADEAAGRKRLSGEQPTQEK